MSKTFANWKIGSKLALLVISGIGPIVCLGLLALWGLSAISTAVDHEQAEADKMTGAERLASKLGRVNTIVGHITLSQHCELCHGAGNGGSRENQAALAKECQSLMNDLKTMENIPEGRKLVAELDKAGSSWLATNIHVLELGHAGKTSDAAALYRDESTPEAGPVDHALRNYLSWQQPRLTAEKEHAKKVKASIPLPVAFLSFLALFVTTLLGIAITRSITRPLTVIVGHLEEVSQGDVSREVDHQYLDRGDEIGILSRHMQAMSKSLRGLLEDIQSGIQVMSSSSAELSANAKQMSEGSRAAFDQAHSAAAATGTMTTNALSVASGMEQTSTNLTSVAAATEQMTSTIGEIAGNSEKARRITTEARQQALHIQEQMNQLGAAAQQIGMVTETITQISSQTNLLALNATIEAARAGSAGKGFAVVASEIKILAHQAAAATEDIKAKIASVQTSTTEGISEIGKVTLVIQQVSDLVASIAAAIEEQSTVTKDIARNISEASSGVRGANQLASQNSHATAEIARDIAGVDQAAGQMADGSEQVNVSALELSRLADQLQTTMLRFKL